MVLMSVVSLLECPLLVYKHPLFHRLLNCYGGICRFYDWLREKPFPSATLLAEHLMAKISNFEGTKNDKNMKKKQLLLSNLSFLNDFPQIALV